MRAMQLARPRTPLVAVDCDAAAPGADEIVIAVSACGVCPDANRALADLRDGRATGAAVPLPGKTASATGA